MLSLDISWLGSARPKASIKEPVGRAPGYLSPSKSTTAGAASPKWRRRTKAQALPQPKQPPTQEVRERYRQLAAIGLSWDATGVPGWLRPGRGVSATAVCIAVIVLGSCRIEARWRAAAFGAPPALNAFLERHSGDHNCGDRVEKRKPRTGPDDGHEGCERLAGAQQILNAFPTSST